jgi:glycosyltransferase involved in cell wall biosynthesis
MTRILHLVPHVRNRGNGTVNVAVDLATLQAKAGYAVTVAAETGEYRSLLEAAGVNFVEFPHPKTALARLRSPFRYRRLVRATRPEIVHAHVVTGILLAALLRFGSKYKVVASLHSEFRRSAVLYGLADRIISVSAASAATLRRRGIGRNKITVIENAPLGSPRLPLAAPSRTNEMSHPAITTLAGLTFRKGIDVLLDAFESVHRDVPKAHLYIIGEGPDREAFLAQAASLQARENVHFLGFQPDPQPYLAGTDIFVLASRREPFGLVIVEARAAGCAIVASDVDGIPEALDGRRSGLLVPAGDPGPLAAALVSLLTNEEALARWKRLALEGLEKYDVARLHRETLGAYALA